jgi:endonuclease YncB( thermonuclease family)
VVRAGQVLRPLARLADYGKTLSCPGQEKGHTSGQDDRPSRSEAMRRLIKLALASQGRRGGMMIRLWFAVLLLFVATAHADPIASQDIYFIDGDTIAVHGKTIRLVGFDAPELGGHAHCGIERMLAARATSRLRQIIRTGDAIDLQLIDCSCRPRHRRNPTVQLRPRLRVPHGGRPGCW